MQGYIPKTKFEFFLGVITFGGYNQYRFLKQIKNINLNYINI